MENDRTNNMNVDFMKDNGLVQNKCKSDTEYYSRGIAELELNNFIKEIFKSEGYYIAYLYNKIIIGKFKSDKLINRDNEDIQFNYLIKIRIFNKDKELYIWKSSSGFKARLRIDSEGVDVIYIEANQVLFGTKHDEENSKNNYTTITEDRGTEITLPFEIKTLNEHKIRIKIKTRHYIDYDENNNAGYIDSRFVDFTIGHENKSLTEEN